MTPLTQRSLANAREGVGRPGYDRGRLATGIVHIGLGAFHRAHQALYTEKVLEAGDLRWGIIGASLRDPGVAQVLAAQDHLYSVTERTDGDVRTRVVGALRGALYAPNSLQQLIATIADPATSIVCCTVTEKGYSQNPATSDLDTRDPAIQHDREHPSTPRSTLGVLAAGIRLRPTNAPLNLVCCDNMASNGDTLRKLLVQYAELFDTNLARRIATEIALPNSMVDRIVPAATPASLDLAEALLGLRDEAAIVCEPFTQWVIENRFVGPRPPWEDAGALLTGDILPYQAMKLRLLNGTHSAIAYAGQLCGLESVSDAMTDPVVGGFARRLMLEDLSATVVPPAGFDVPAYCRQLLERFENTSLVHRTQQIAMDGTQKVPVRWLPALKESLAQGIERPHLERALAIWLFYLVAGHDALGRTIIINDPGASALAARMNAASADLDKMREALSHSSVFGQETWPSAFILRMTGHLSTLRQRGMSALMGC